MYVYGSGLLENIAYGNLLAMLLDFSFRTGSHREKGRSPYGSEYASFVRLCCLGASICLFCLKLSSLILFLFTHSQGDGQK